MVQALYSRNDTRTEEKRIVSGEFAELAELFKVFGDSTRIRILYALFSGEKNVTELCNDLTMNQSAVSSAEDSSDCEARARQKRREEYCICFGG